MQRVLMCKEHDPGTRHHISIYPHFISCSRQLKQAKVCNYQYTFRSFCPSADTLSYQFKAKRVQLLVICIHLDPSASQLTTSSVRGHCLGHQEIRLLIYPSTMKIVKEGVPTPAGNIYI